MVEWVHSLVQADKPDDSLLLLIAEVADRSHFIIYSGENWRALFFLETRSNVYNRIPVILLFPP